MYGHFNKSYSEVVGATSNTLVNYMVLTRNRYSEMTSPFGRHTGNPHV